ncbi:MAG: hypothetical protein ACP5R2_03460 [Anaerolineae bacterium]
MTPSGGQTQYIWLAFEASEVIELKRITLDRDVAAANDLFWRVVVPRVVTAAQRRGLQIEIDRASGGGGGRLSG